jgi:hypothetical protein
MSIVAPRPQTQPEPEELEALIREARRRQRRRQIGIAAGVALLAAIVLAGSLLVGGSSRPAAPPPVASAASPRSAAPRLLLLVAPLKFGRPGLHGLQLVDRHGRVLRVVSAARFGTFGRWSPNGQTIAWRDPAGIHIANANGSNARLLVAGASACEQCQQFSFLWSPDGRSLVVGSEGPKGNELLRLPLDRGAPKVLAAPSTAGVFLSPAFWTTSGDLVYTEEGTTLAFPFSLTVELTPATGKTRTLVKTPNGHAPLPPFISPNGREWAYVREADQYHQQLRIVDRATGQAHIVRGVNPTNFVGWSPDSRSLAVIESGWHVVTIAPDGTLQHQIGPGQDIFWGRDRELFVLRAKDRQVWVSENGRPETFLFRLPRNTQVLSLDSN